MPTTIDQFVTVSVANLRPGARLRAPLYDAYHANNVLLLARGSTITESNLRRLELRGIKFVRVRSSELARVTSAGSHGAAARQAAKRRARRAPTALSDQTEVVSPQDAASRRWSVSSKSFVHRLRRHGENGYDRTRTASFNRDYRRSVGQVETLFGALMQSELADGRELAELADEALSKITADMDLVVSLGLQPAAEQYPFQHSLQTAILGAGVGTVLGLTHQELVEMGIGCLVHDSGMLYVPQSLVNAPKTLNRIEFLEITKHPTVTFDLLRNVSDLPPGSRLVAYQMHERCNGSGYPRGRLDNQIHPLAKIAAVTDVFVAMLSPRPHRPARLPYHAMEQLIYDAREGLFDPEIVRALLKTVSLFPIGSWVETSDGRVGRVVRANHDAYTRPVVELWSPHDGGASSEIVDLSQSDLEIARPIRGPGQPARRNEDA